MRSTKDVSDSNDENDRGFSECVLPNDQIVQGELNKVRCDDPCHGDKNMREGEQVYAILAEDDDKLMPRSIACRECSAQSIYEYVDKDTHLYIVDAVLEPTVCHGPDGMKLTRINVLDEYVPIDSNGARV